MSPFVMILVIFCAGLVLAPVMAVVFSTLINLYFDRKEKMYSGLLLVVSKTLDAMKKEKESKTKEGDR